MKSNPKPKHSGYERQTDEWYVEPTWCVDLLFEAESFKGTIWDASCGEGTIPASAKRYGYKTYATDLVDRGYPDFDTVLDFIKSDDDMFEEYTIVSNPPYGRAITLVDFIDAALARKADQVAVIVNESFLFAERRHDLFTSKWPLKKVYCLSSRPSMPPGGMGIEAKGGTANYCWLIFQNGHTGPATIDWLKRQK